MRGMLSTPPSHRGWKERGPARLRSPGRQGRGTRPMVLGSGHFPCVTVARSSLSRAFWPLVGSGEWSARGAGLAVSL